MDKTSKSKKIRLEITLNVKNADMDQTMNNKKTLTGKTSNGKNVDKGTKGRREKTSKLRPREYFKGLHTDTYWKQFFTQRSK